VISILIWLRVGTASVVAIVVIGSERLVGLRRRDDNTALVAVGVLSLRWVSVTRRRPVQRCPAINSSIAVDRPRVKSGHDLCRACVGGYGCQGDQR